MPPAARPPITASLRIRNKMMEAFHGIGLPVGPVRILRVRGRVSGREYSNPVATLKWDGALYLLQAFPHSDWVKNVRAAGEGVLVRGRHAQHVRLVEVPPAERGPIARAFPGQVPMGVGIFVRNGVVEDKSPESFGRAAADIPIFRAEPV